VLQLIADGHANPQIARQLLIGEETVKSHMRSIFARLQARSRAHAVAIALRDGLISRIATMISALESGAESSGRPGNGAS
jgi:ATP/maltotriose-dependent transcriptional regulator MalT